MDEIQLEVVIAVDRLRSFSAAGRALNHSQSTVSRHVAAVERTLGSELFTRGKAGVGRTSAGERLLPGVIDLRQKFIDLRQAARIGRAADET